MKIIFSLHDVCPFHLERIQKAEAFFAKWGVEKVTYLYVPAYHHNELSHESSVFREFCLQSRPFSVDWWLHGYYHIASSMTISKKISWKARWKEKHLTGGEGEFLSLDIAEVKERLENGLSSFRSVFSNTPLGFVAPAWLYNELLPKALRNIGICFTENHLSIFNVVKGQEWKAPAITWATRTWFRRKASLFVCPILYKFWKNNDVLRIAVHPYDFDHPETIASIESLLVKSIQNKKQCFVNEL